MKRTICVVGYDYGTAKPMLTWFNTAEVAEADFRWHHAEHRRGRCRNAWRFNVRVDGPADTFEGQVLSLLPRWDALHTDHVRGAALDYYAA